VNFIGYPGKFVGTKQTYHSIIFRTLSRYDPNHIIHGRSGDNYRQNVGCVVPVEAYHSKVKKASKNKFKKI
jgi:hypothetical protein